MAVESLELTQLPKREVLRYMGYRGQEYTSELDTIVDSACGHCLELARPKASWLAFDVTEISLDGDTPHVRMDGTTFELPGHSIARYLDGAVSVVLMAVTVGMDLERELRLTSVTDPVFGIALDAAATAAVEEAADILSAHISTWAAHQGLRAGGRFSPGYGDLPLDVQPQLLSVLDAQRRLGITLSQSLLMTPTKSITAVTGLFGAQRDVQG